MNMTSEFEISPHAELRILERTNLSGGQILQRINENSCYWLDDNKNLNRKYAIIYFASEKLYIIAVIAINDKVVVTLLNVEQFERDYGIIPYVYLSLARQLALQKLEPISSTNKKQKIKKEIGLYLVVSTTEQGRTIYREIGFLSENNADFLKTISNHKHLQIKDLNEFIKSTLFDDFLFSSFELHNEIINRINRVLITIEKKGTYIEVLRSSLVDITLQIYEKLNGVEPTPLLSRSKQSKQKWKNILIDKKINT